MLASHHPSQNSRQHTWAISADSQPGTTQNNHVNNETESSLFSPSNHNLQLSIASLKAPSDPLHRIVSIQATLLHHMPSKEALRPSKQKQAILLPPSRVSTKQPKPHCSEKGCTNLRGSPKRTPQLPALTWSHCAKKQIRSSCPPNHQRAASLLLNCTARSQKLSRNPNFIMSRTVPTPKPLLL